MSQQFYSKFSDMEDLNDLEKIDDSLPYLNDNHYNDVSSFEKTNAIIKFFMTKRKNLLKKEYVRAHIIRKHKKFLRLAFSTKKSSINDLPIKKNLHIYQIFIDAFNKHAIENKDILMKYSKTEEGPLTDGKAKRKQYNSEKSFNILFCKSYFQTSEVVSSFLLMIGILFADRNPDSLCMIFRYYCCHKKKHSSYCFNSWDSLFEFYAVHLLVELEADVKTMNNTETQCENV